MVTSLKKYLSHWLLFNLSIAHNLVACVELLKELTFNRYPRLAHWLDIDMLCFLLPSYALVLSSLGSDSFHHDNDGNAYLTSFANGNKIQ